MSTLDLAVIGNCAYSALVDRSGRIPWACMPDIQGDPVFCSLLNPDAEHGFFEVHVDHAARAEQHYVQNTAILSTTVTDEAGAAVAMTDFAPRYMHFDRYVHPPVLVRHLRPVGGTPRVTVRLRPLRDYGAARFERLPGSNHVRYTSPDLSLRLTTDAPAGFIMNETAFLLDRPVTLLFGLDEPVTGPVDDTGRNLYRRTLSYWRRFTQYLSIPFEWQDAVIRAAITLKLCSADESGAIVAALTTSIPEAPDSGRNWDYRFCWLRDAYFVVQCLNRLGATGTMSRYLRYITNIIATAQEDGTLQPVYGIGLEEDLSERIVTSLPGYRGMGPVRVGNQAFAQVQNDVYGSVVLAMTQLFFDQRLAHRFAPQLFDTLERVGTQAARRFNQPDASLWELRRNTHVHTYSSVVSWAACDRLAKMAQRLGRAERSAYWRATADRMREEILHRAWNPALNSFVSTFEGSAVDASLLLLHELAFVDVHDPRFAGTVAQIERALKRGDRIFRYASDEFGEPTTAFTVCTFWYIDALAALGRTEEARDLFLSMLASRNSLGLLSEDLMPDSSELWGNFPQSYSMVGLINSAMRLSKRWDAAF